MMHKDEPFLLGPWVDYHSKLFGKHSIYIFDNGSTDPRALRILNLLKDDGFNIDSAHASGDDFSQKGEIVLDLIRKLEERALFDWYFPLDCDEFICLAEGGAVSTNSVDIHRYLEGLPRIDKVLRISHAYDNCPTHPQYYFKSQQRKCFFQKNVVKELDRGSHVATSYVCGTDYYYSNIAYVHMHFRDYASYCKSCRNKLEPFVQSFSEKDLCAHLEQKGPGFHLVNGLLMGKQEYYKRSFFRFLEHQDCFVKIDEFTDFMDLYEYNNRFLDVPYSKSPFEVHGHIDSISIKDDVLSVLGWAYQDGVMDTLLLSLEADAKLILPTSISWHSRLDVQSIYNTSSQACGFKADFSMTGISTREFLLFVSDKHGKLGKPLVISCDP